MALEVGEDVLDEEGLQGRALQSRQGGAVPGFDEQRGGRREQVVENPPLNVEDRLDVRHAPVTVDLQVGDVALRTPDLHEDRPPGVDRRRLPVGSGFEVVEQVELHEVDDAGGDFVDHPVPVTVGRGVLLEGHLDLVDPAVEHHARRRHDALARLRLRQIGIDGLEAHLRLEGADEEFAHRDCAALQEERAHAQVRVDAFNLRRDQPETAEGVGVDDNLAVVDPLAVEIPESGRGTSHGRR